VFEFSRRGAEPKNATMTLQPGPIPYLHVVSILFFLQRDAALARYMCCHRVSDRPSDGVRTSVCPSVRHKPVVYRNDWTNRAGFWHGGFLPPIVRKFGYLQKSGHFPLELFSKLRTFKNFATASRSSCQQNSSSSSSSSSTVERVDNRRVVAVYYKLVNCNSQTPLGLLRFLVDSLYNLFLQLTRFCLTTRRGSRASRSIFELQPLHRVAHRQFEHLLRSEARRHAVEYVARVIT